MARRYLYGVLALVLIGTALVTAGNVPAAEKSQYDHWLNSVVVVRSSIGEGTGFFITADGLLVTNHHVVGNDDRVYIGLRQGGSTTGTIVALDEDLDLALVSVPVDSRDFLELARPNEAWVGSDVIAIGTARGLSWSVSRGIVSGLRDGADFNIGNGRDVLLIQTDAAINPGNSGGPLILMDSGNVVGVNTISFKKDIAEGISFAVSSDNVRSVFDKYLKGERPVIKPPTGTASTAKERLAAWMADPNAAIANLTKKPGNGEDSPTPEGHTGITLANAKKFSINNTHEGQLLVITGRAKNTVAEARSYIRLEGTLHDETGKVLRTTSVYAGNFLNDAELKTFTMKEIEARLNEREGLKGANLNIPLGHSVTFMVVFNQVPAEAKQWYVTVESAE